MPIARIHQNETMGSGDFILNGIIRQKIVSLLHHISLDAKESLGKNVISRNLIKIFSKGLQENSYGTRKLAKFLPFRNNQEVFFL